MELLKVLEKRKSCRKFKPMDLQEGDREDLDQIIYAGTRAPYASSGPHRYFKVVAGPKLKLLQKACHDQEWVGSCLAAFVVIGTRAEYPLKSGHDRYVLDCAASVMCMDLMATSLGYGTCWIGHFDRVAVNEVCETSDIPVIVLLVGVPDAQR